MRNKLVLKLLAVVFGLALIGAACTDDSEDTSASGDSTETTAAEEETTTTTMAEGVDMTDKTVVEIAQEDGSFTTLVDLVTTAGLAETLSGAGPFTVMAPSDDAFAQVPQETLQQLASDPTGALANVLKLHVISGEVLAADAAEAAGTCVDTLGGKVKIEQDGEDLTFGGAKIVKTNIKGSNGVIHVIDGVVTAPSTDC